MLDGNIETVEEKFEDSGYQWEYGKAAAGRAMNESSYTSGGKVKTYKLDTDETPKMTATSYNYRTAESFLDSLKQKQASNSVDISQYQEGQRIYHKKFGEGIIQKMEEEGDDYKLDIQFDKSGHKRLMAKFAGLQIIE